MARTQSSVSADVVRLTLEQLNAAFPKPKATPGFVPPISNPQWGGISNPQIVIGGRPRGSRSDQAALDAMAKVFTDMMATEMIRQHDLAKQPPKPRYKLADTFRELLDKLND